MIDSAALLSALPPGLRGPLLEEYKGIVTAYAEGKWKLSALDAGRFCEVVFTVLEGALTGAFANAPAKPSRFADSCRSLENRTPIAVGDRSIRILVPRVLVGLYDIRNNRNVGHVGGDVVANKMDATFVRDGATWVLAELVRVFHATDTATAQASVDSLVDRPLPLIWEYEGKKRVLAPGMRAKDKVLLFLHASHSGETMADLEDWTKYQSKFRKQVIAPLEKDLLVEVNASTLRVVITPLGAARVEKVILTAGFQ